MSSRAPITSINRDEIVFRAQLLRTSGREIRLSLSGPAGLPEGIVQKVNRELVRAMNQPEAQQRLRQDGLLSQPMSPDELGRFIAAETARWKPVVERVGLLQRFH